MKTSDLKGFYIVQGIWAEISKIPTPNPSASISWIIKAWALLYSSLPPASDPTSPSKPIWSCYLHSRTLSHIQPQCCFWKSPSIQVCFYRRAFVHDFLKNPSRAQNFHPHGSAHFLQMGPLLKSHLTGNLPGSPVAKTLYFQCRENSFHPWLGN